MPSKRPWPSLASSAFFPDADGGTWAVGDDGDDSWATGLASNTVASTPFTVTDAWTSDSGVTYLATKYSRGIVRAEPPNFSDMHIDLPSRASFFGVENIAGRSGKDGAPDDLFCVASLDDGSRVLGQRRGGKWTEHPVVGVLPEMAVMAVSPSSSFSSSWTTTPSFAKHSNATPHDRSALVRESAAFVAKLASKKSLPSKEARFRELLEAARKERA